MHVAQSLLINLCVVINEPQSTHSCWKTQAAQVTDKGPHAPGGNQPVFIYFEKGGGRKLQAYSLFNQGFTADMLGKFKENWLKEDLKQDIVTALTVNTSLHGAL